MIVFTFTTNERGRDVQMIPPRLSAGAVSERLVPRGIIPRLLKLSQGITRLVCGYILLYMSDRDLRSVLKHRVRQNTPPGGLGMPRKVCVASCVVPGHSETSAQHNYTAIYSNIPILEYLGLVLERTTFIYNDFFL